MMRHAATVGLVALLLSAGATGCATLDRSGKSLVPTRHEVRTGPYSVHTNFPISDDSPAVRQLRALDARVESVLGLRVDPARSPIDVYVLDDRDSFMHLLMYYYPDFPPRRAFFLAQGHTRAVYTYKGERLEEDLRHEATHALLHAAVGGVPLWLDEGLAEYFESPDGPPGMNREHFERLPADRTSGWAPDLSRLEGMTDVRSMSRRDYRESWAWVHYVLNGPPAGRAALLSYLADLRAGVPAEPLSARLGRGGTDAGAALLAHLDRLKSAPAGRAASASGEVVRLQDAPAEVVTALPTPRRRSLLARVFRGLFGGD